MYDAKRELLVGKKPNRYSIGDRTAGIKFEKAGSLTVTMSCAEPSGADAKAKRLPAPITPCLIAHRVDGGLGAQRFRATRDPPPPLSGLS